MTVKQRIIEAVEENSPEKINEVVVFLRFGLSLSYAETFDMFNRITGISQPEFETLICESEA